MRGLLFHNWPQKLASLAIAILLWQLVLRIEEPQGRKSFENIHINYVNRPSNLEIVEGRTTVRVEATSTIAEALPSIGADAITAVVDLSNAKPGTWSYPVKLDYPSKIDRFARLVPDPDTVRVTLELTRERTLRVVTRITGKKEGFTLGPLSLDPYRVRIFGAEGLVNRARLARVTVNLSGVNPGEASELPVEVLDEADRPLPLTIDPPEVVFRANLVALPPQKNLLVQPIWKGSPMFGYRVVRYEIRPNYITVSGDAKALAEMNALETEPIDITGIQAGRSYTVGLRLREGLRISGSRSVVVTVQVEPQAGNSPR